MFPDFTLFGQTYPLYTLAGLAAVFAAAGAASLRSKKIGLNFSDMLIAVVFLGAGLVVGGVILHAIVRAPFLWEYRQVFLQRPFVFLRAAFGGMVFYGGLFGAMAAMPIYAKFVKRDLADIVRLAVPVFPLAHAIMRLGCFAAGCCHGIIHDTLGIAFTRSLSAPNDIPFLPVQLIESAMNMVIFAAVWWFTKKERKAVHVVCLYGLMYAVGRFGLEFLRGDAVRGSMFFLSTSQFISVLVVIACVIALIVDRNGRKLV